jgi:NADH-quinone oxidoreductase subunit N
MTLPNLTSADLLPVLPAIILSSGAALLLLSEVFLQSPSRSYQAVLGIFSALLAGGVALATTSLPSRSVFLGFAAQDAFSSWVTAMVCLGLALSLLCATNFLQHRRAERGEFYALMLFATAGMSLLAISTELITLFVSLEVMTVSTYALTSYLRRGPRPSEAGFKYFILGAFSAALLLYGTALLYGATGTTRLSGLASQLGSAAAQSPLLVGAGVLFIATGLTFKVAAVPFHMWTPDVYEGAPTPVTALMSVGVKAAAFAALVRVFMALGQNLDSQNLVMLFSGLALLTMVVGNLLAIPQRNVKRMLAYSSIAHAGYVLLGVAALFARTPHEGEGHLLLPSPLLAGQPAAQGEILRAILFYLLAYTVTAVGAFGTLSILEKREEEERGTAWDLERFSGLAQRRPGWAVAMAAFMLSLGGIPPTVGFMAKLLIFRSAIDVGLVSLAIVGVLSSAAGVYYYLRIVVYMFMRPAVEGSPVPERQWATEVALVISTAAVMVLGIVPGPLSKLMAQGALLFGH